MEQFGDWNVYPPYEEEQEAAELVNPHMELAESLDASYGSDKVRLYRMLERMSAWEKEMFVKIIQQDAMMDVLNAVKNLKKTSEEEWKRTIGKLISIKGMKTSGNGNFDFNGMLDKMIPALAFLAGMLLAMRESERKDSESAEPNDADNPLVSDPNIESGIEGLSEGSIIMRYCKNMENGFSL